MKNRTDSKQAMPSAKEHTINEINALISTLELTGGDGNTAQYGGRYSSIRAMLKADGLQGYEVHHMPSNAVQNAPMGELPSIALKSEDHAKTDSYRGKQNRKTDSFLPGGPPSVTYRNETARMIENDRYADVVAAEVYNIKDRFGDKYDGAIAQYLESVKEYISEHGIPEAVYGSDKVSSNDCVNTQSCDKNNASAEFVESASNEKEMAKMSKNSFLDKIKSSFTNKNNNSNPNDADATEDSGESSDTEIGERVREHTSPRENSFLESIKVDTKENNQNSQNTQVTAPAQSNNQSFSNNGNGQTQGGESGHGSSRGEGGGRGGR